VIVSDHGTDQLRSHSLGADGSLGTSDTLTDTFEHALYLTESAGADTLTVPLGGISRYVLADAIQTCRTGLLEPVNGRPAIPAQTGRLCELFIWRFRSSSRKADQPFQPGKDIFDGRDSPGLIALG
jgi:hypothetical protein